MLLVEEKSKEPMPYLENVDSTDLYHEVITDYDDCELIGWGAQGHPYPHSDQTKRLMSQIKTGTKRSEASKKKQSRTVSGKNNHFYGKTQSPEAKKVMSEKAKIRLSGSGNTNAKKVVYQGEVFGCKKFITEKYGMSLYMINKKIETGEIYYG